MEIDHGSGTSVAQRVIGEPLMIRNGILLRPMVENDINERYLSWFGDDQVTFFLDSKNLTPSDAKNYFREGKQSGRRVQFAVCDSASGLHIGSVKLGDIDVKSRLSDLVTVIGDRNYWGKGVATTAIQMGSQIAFEHYHLRKLNGGIHAKNTGSIKAYTRAGWVIEAVLHSHHISADGSLCDRVVVSCFNPAEYPTLPVFPLPLPA